MKVTFVRPNMTRERSSDAMPPLAFAALKAGTPAEVETDFYDECIEAIPLNLETDLVAMSAHTFSAYRTYQLSEHFRGKGIPVVLGGYHPTFLPDEALRHADAVLAGPAEGLWGQVLKDAQNKCLKPLYQNAAPVDGRDIRYDMEIFRGKRYTPVFPVEFTRGCRYACEFCSVSAFNRNRTTIRPREAVVEEIAGSGATRVLIVDDNIFSDKESARSLFEALIPLNVKWGCQISIDIAKDRETLSLMARSGCILFMIGFETLQPENLKQMAKGSHASTRDYAEAIRKIKAHGIMIYGSFVFGYDSDSTDIFQRTLDFAVQQKLAIANFNTLNPMPGTRLYDRLKATGRLIQDEWWLDPKYRYGEVMFRPSRMTADELKKGCIKLRLEFSRYASIMKRALDFDANCRNLHNASLFWLANLITRKEYKRKMRRIAT